MQFNYALGRRGFTLVELLVVIAIIGMIAAVIMSSLSSGRKKSRDARRIADVRGIQNALNLYSTSNKGIYPAVIDDLVTGSYINQVPSDPSGTAYSYAGILGGGICSSYHLGSSLEMDDNPALNLDADAVAASSVCSGSAADFSGADPNNKCNAADIGVSCYDIKE